jgi:hypothetical protein
MKQALLPTHSQYVINHIVDSIAEIDLNEIPTEFHHSLFLSLTTFEMLNLALEDQVSNG